MSNEMNSQIEIVDLLDSDTSIEVGVELSAFELLAVSGGQKCTWTCGQQNKCDEWVP